MCVSVRERERDFVCVCVCVSAREREGGSEGGKCTLRSSADTFFPPNSPLYHSRQASTLATSSSALGYRPEFSFFVMNLMTERPWPATLDGRHERRDGGEREGRSENECASERAGRG